MGETQDYLHRIGTVAEFTERYWGEDYHEPWVSRVDEDGDVEYNRRIDRDALRLEVESAGTLYWRMSGNTSPGLARTVSYSLNGRPWVDVTSSASPEGIPLEAGDVIAFRGDNASYAFSGETSGDRVWNCFSGSMGLKFRAAGNVMSLIDSVNFRKLRDFTADFALMGLFRGCPQLTDVSGLRLPATGLTLGCYAHMFSDCGNLRGRTPYLPAVRMARSCYRSMWQNCVGLTSADIPEMPEGKVLDEKCFSNMFNGCAGLTDTVELPETTLAQDCYAYMYRDCVSLTGVTELPATRVSPSAYFGMFMGCSALVTPPALPATSLGYSSYQEMFLGCSSLLNTPDLPATVLPSWCYHRMFQGCVSLTGAPRSITVDRCVRTPSDNSCMQMQMMFQGCVALTAAPEIIFRTYPTPDVDAGLNSMFRGCSSLREIKVNFMPGNLSTTSSGGNDCALWVEGVAASGTFHLPESLRGQTVRRDDGHVPTGWTVRYYQD